MKNSSAVLRLLAFFFVALLGLVLVYSLPAQSNPYLESSPEPAVDLVPDLQHFFSLANPPSQQMWVNGKAIFFEKFLPNWKLHLQNDLEVNDSLKKLELQVSNQSEKLKLYEADSQTFWQTMNDSETKWQAYAVELMQQNDRLTQLATRLEDELKQASTIAIWCGVGGVLVGGGIVLAVHALMK